MEFKNRQYKYRGLIILFMMMASSLFLNGQEKKRQVITDDLYYSASDTSDYVPLNSRLEGLTAAELNLYLKNAINTRNAGMVLTILGGGLAFTGGYILAREAFSFTVQALAGANPSEDVVNVAGVIFLSGCTMTIVGIPLWIMGSSNKHKAELAIVKLNNPANQSASIAIGFKVRF